MKRSHNFAIFCIARIGSQVRRQLTIFLSPFPSFVVAYFWPFCSFDYANYMYCFLVADLRHLPCSSGGWPNVRWCVIRRRRRVRPSSSSLRAHSGDLRPCPGRKSSQQVKPGNSTFFVSFYLQKGPEKSPLNENSGLMMWPMTMMFKEDFSMKRVLIQSRNKLTNRFVHQQH